MSRERTEVQRFVERLHREWLAATGGMSEAMADGIARALLPTTRRLARAKTAESAADRGDAA
jgi:hypothetical protein